MKRVIRGAVAGAYVVTCVCCCLVSCAAGPVRTERTPLVAGSGPAAPIMLLAGRDEPIARLPGVEISREQYLAPLIEGHGLPALINVVQLDLARHNAERAGVKITDEDLNRARQDCFGGARGIVCFSPEAFEIGRDTLND